MTKNKLFIILTLSSSLFFCSDKELSDVTNVTISTVTSLSSQDSSLQQGTLRRVSRIPSNYSNSSLQEEVQEYFQKVIAPTIKMVESSDNLEDLN